ncbi:hypothetical protein [Spirosoma pollinicola]|uniref:Uncharacterized protein n=1 Tax=Spirosoma pollinicola TaxID=2057025 RepID=A0A2K8Z470_9BACT|nr:hypothetical protein [Spirosoma pollinicola]AUD04696.1 hypothetical protein CWM47_24320 [Spirosoma pollinicola]
MLTPTQLTAISQHLKKSGIIYEEVHHELLDHFANAVDAQITNKITFENALLDVSRQFGGPVGLKYIQTTQSQAMNRQYRQRLRHYFSVCVQWPNVLQTLAVVWLLYTLIDLAPNMMTVAYSLMVVAAIPFLVMLTLTGKHLWQFFRRERQLAWSLDGFTLLSKSLSTAMMFVYPNLFVYLGMMTPKNTAMNSVEQGIYFVMSCFIAFLCFAQVNLIVSYSKSTDKPLSHSF